MLPIIVICFTVILENIVEFSLVICFAADFPLLTVKLSVFVIPLTDQVLQVVLLHLSEHTISAYKGT
jgi:hypothetical protein